MSEVRSRVLDEIGRAGEGGRRVSKWVGWMGGWVGVGGDGAACERVVVDLDQEGS